MLHVEKQQLLATNAQEIARFRATELQYYVEHIGSIQTIATLLAGFAFTAFLSMETLDMSVPTVLFQQWRGDFEVVNNASAVVRKFDPIDPVGLAVFVVHAVEVFSVVLCLVEMISVLLETLLARLLGSRLALRGPDGSIIIATKGLAKSLLKATERFIIGLQWFLFSVVCHALRGQHPVISGCVLAMIFFYWRMQFGLAKRLATEFFLPTAVHTSFGPSARDTEGASPLSEPSITDSQARAVQAADAAARATRRGLCGRLQNAFLLQMVLRQVDDVHGEDGIDSVAYRRPTKASEQLIMQLQGRGLGEPSRSSRRQASRYLPRISRSRSRGDTDTASWAAGAGAVPPEAINEPSSPMGEWKRALGSLFGFNLDGPSSREPSGRASRVTFANATRDVTRPSVASAASCDSPA
jgi:hypothetical protein